MFKIVAIICLVGYNGHLLECNKTQVDLRNFHTKEACIDDAQIKYKQLSELLSQSDNTYTLKVYCEPILKNSI
jgi:hypothetical protein